jgi:SAM-dependent methyltransferase
VALAERLHAAYVHPRRIGVLGERVAPLLPPNARVIDIGAGDGRVARATADLRSDVEVQGVDVLVRPDAAILVAPFDGVSIPYPDGSFDAALLIDVVHHASDPLGLLREAARVASRCVIVKDHLVAGVLARPTLRFMDAVGNARHGVPLPYHFWPPERWADAFATLGLAVTSWETHLGLYPRPARWVFERSLHFLARLEPRA